MHQQRNRKRYPDKIADAFTCRDERSVCHRLLIRSLRRTLYVVRQTEVGEIDGLCRVHYLQNDPVARARIGLDDDALEFMSGILLELRECSLSVPNTYRVRANLNFV